MIRVPNDMPRRQRASQRLGDAADFPTPPETPPAEGTGGAPRRQPPWDKPAEPESSASFGDWLRRQREMREITLRDIADRTKISLRYLKAMEDNRFDLLPAPIFAKGFLKEYARYVGLSPDEVVNHYLAVQQQEMPEQEARKDQASRPHRGQPVQSWTWGLILVLAVVALLALIVFLVWYADRRSRRLGDGTPPGIAAPAEPAAVPPATSQPGKSSAPLEVTLDFTATCWVEVTVDGKPFVSEVRVQGESLPVEAQRGIDLKLGDAGAVEMQVNGYPYPLNGKAGEVRELHVDLETVHQLRERKEAR